MAKHGRIASDEADEKQLAMALAEGDAYQKSLTYMVEEVADASAKTTAGDYIVAIAQERAEGMYQVEGGDLVWVEPDDENCHLEVSVSDAADHRFVPALDITATLAPASGESIGPVKVPFLWHPGLYHYGVDLKVPRDGLYTVRLHIAVPTFGRHDKKNGRRFSDAVDVAFKAVAFKTGRE